MHGLLDLWIRHLPHDLWLRGFLKSKVYHDQPASLPTLKDGIWKHVSVILNEMLLHAINSAVPHLAAKLLNDEQHTEHSQTDN
ncbi:hypothetical protein AVEN_170745-1 [Araneus ventricosus]|uniref:Uncharacterized protein n=1 Tax=Araneus ventricosus TaxID=182803 RepID=A0A4Y2CKT8_ARAVE|nr:hypothetical protein AVEN_170745-1 [Araneus ventricosus]